MIYSRRERKDAMIVLCSDGLSSQRLVAELQKFMQNKQTAALVVTADPVYKDHNYHVPRCLEELQSLGLATTLFDLDVQPAELLRNYDVVEFIGGNPFYLLDSIRQHNACKILKEIADQQILIGWSAAAFVFGPTLHLVNKYSPEMNFLGLTDLTGLSLTSVEVLPHYSRFLKKFTHFEEICQTYEVQNNTQVVRLNDGDGVIIQGNQTSILRKEQ